MAFFGVTRETIEKVWPHPNADRLDLATLAGVAFQFVVARNSFAAGERVVYFPVDSVLPAAVTDALGVTGKLAGKNKDRLKTVRLRGEISQGLVGPLSLLDGLDLPMDLSPADEAERIAAGLGVVKYDPPPVMSKGALLRPLPAGLSVYDIEGFERFADAAELLMDRPVVVTEKLEGTNLSVTHDPDTRRTYVNQRNYTVTLEDGADPAANAYWAAAESAGLLALAETLAIERRRPVTLYGELVGPKVQGNYYGLPRLGVYVFDLKVGPNFAPYHELRLIAGANDVALAPLLAENVTLRAWLDGRTVAAASHGPSVLNPDRLREGVVVRPAVEEYVIGFGRLQLKQRDPVYLGETDN